MAIREGRKEKYSKGLLTALNNDGHEIETRFFPDFNCQNLNLQMPSARTTFYGMLALSAFTSTSKAFTPIFARAARPANKASRSASSGRVCSALSMADMTPEEVRF